MHSATTTSAPQPSVPPAPRHWLDDAVADLEGLTEGAGPSLRRRLERALGLLGRMNGGGSLAEALRRPASTPFVPLIDACAADLGLGDDPRAGLVGRSTVMLYAYVRVQDDLVDEPRRVDRASVYAAEALLAAHLRLFAAATADPRAMAARSAIMGRFAEVAAAEVDAWRRRGPPAPGLDWMGEKFLPMAVPLAALAVAAGQARRIETMVRFVTLLGCSLQLVNDVFNVAEDHAGGRTTPVLRWMAEAGVLSGHAPLRAVLLTHPALDRSLDAARSYAEAAEALATREGLPRMAALAAGARARVDEAPQRLFSLMLGGTV